MIGSRPSNIFANHERQYLKFCRRVVVNIIQKAIGKLCPVLSWAFNGHFKLTRCGSVSIYEPPVLFLSHGENTHYILALRSKKWFPEFFASDNRRKLPVSIIAAGCHFSSRLLFPIVHNFSTCVDTFFFYQ